MVVLFIYVWVGDLTECPRYQYQRPNEPYTCTVAHACIRVLRGGTVHCKRRYGTL